MSTLLKMNILFFFIVSVTQDPEKTDLPFNFGDPIPGVDVSLEQIPGGIKATTQTDAKGNYSFKNLQAGKYVLHFGKMNKPSKSKPKRSSEERRSARKDARLSKRALGKANRINNSGEIIIIPFSPDLNSSRSNTSHIYNPRGNDSIPLITTVLTNTKMDLYKVNINQSFELGEPIKILRGLLTK